jgi:hypothetical protein
MFFRWANRLIGGDSSAQNMTFGTGINDFPLSDSASFRELNIVVDIDAHAAGTLLPSSSTTDEADGGS